MCARSVSELRGARSLARGDTAFPFIMDCFLRSRAETGNPSNVEYDEEDVNVYIVNLLCLLLDPVYYVQVQRYIADYDSDVFRKVQDSNDNRLRYWVYKANADHLLVNLGVFGTGEEGGLGGGPLLGRPSRRAAERGKTYYHFARSYCEALSRCRTGVADVLGKLAHGFEKYVFILDHMRGEYFNLIDSLTDGEIFHLQRELNEIEREEYLKKKYDELLDLYLDWKKGKDPEVLAKLKAVADELRQLDPSFAFEIPT